MVLQAELRSWGQTQGMALHLGPQLTLSWCGIHSAPWVPDTLRSLSQGWGQKCLLTVLPPAIEAPPPGL